ncbi:unnamed protein product [Effrenium voratum]|uniref:Calcineurin-like phosphoesterase domain-containing protein n=1 Tax=Effrenium voratum TaxID=2562239 RepID=A0AA36HNB9_9DINO|nr:unnamed protein product [Effrenium voratum]
MIRRPAEPRAPGAQPETTAMPDAAQLPSRLIKAASPDLAKPRATAISYHYATRESRVSRGSVDHSSAGGSRSPRARSRELCPLLHHALLKEMRSICKHLRLDIKDDVRQLLQQKQEVRSEVKAKARDESWPLDRPTLPNAVDGDLEVEDFLPQPEVKGLGRFAWESREPSKNQQSPRKSSEELVFAQRTPAVPLEKSRYLSSVAAGSEPWVYDQLWAAGLTLRQGFVEAPGSRGPRFLYAAQLKVPKVDATGAPSGPEVCTELPKKKAGAVRLVLVSDTHERHAGLVLPACDAVLHCGDILACSRMATQRHAEAVLKDFGDWLRTADTGKCARFVIAGNHDFWIEELGKERVQELLGEEVQYLEFTSGSFEVSDGAGAKLVSVFGAPISAGKSMNRAFQHPQALEQLESTHLECCDIALTHGPLSSLVKRKAQPAIGQMLARLRPSLHVYGHIHGMYGRISRISEQLQGLSINASIMFSHGKLRGQRPENPPIVFDIMLPEKSENSV